MLSHSKSNNKSIKNVAKGSKKRREASKGEAKKQARSKLGGEGANKHTTAEELSPKYLRHFSTHKKKYFPGR